MPYPSVDALQRALTDTVFVYATDRKKAAGRALGTLVEIITYYLLKGWGFRDSVAIDPPFPNTRTAPSRTMLSIRSTPSGSGRNWR